MGNKGKEAEVEALLIRRNFLPSYHSNEKCLARQVRETGNNETFSAPIKLYMFLYVQGESLHKGNCKRMWKHAQYRPTFQGGFEVSRREKSPRGGLVFFCTFLFLPLGLHRHSFDRKISRNKLQWCPAPADKRASNRIPRRKHQSQRFYRLEVTKQQGLAPCPQFSAFLINCAAAGQVFPPFVRNSHFPFPIPKTHSQSPKFRDLPFKRRAFRGLRFCRRHLGGLALARSSGVGVVAR